MVNSPYRDDLIVKIGWLVIPGIIQPSGSKRPVKVVLILIVRAMTCARTANNDVLKILTFVACVTNIRSLTQSALYNF